ncbi:uncharacterized protein LOC128351057 isoform X1 [Hemicordylus capensis]|uniref:uncharacterized protein LOC128351057 isoform X1 n=1 Tax=Hemicordylus capensis TaxID=884348 RepID=UPI00230420BB|nr:uncharacterized protein LOC128351057 isoform X1 [Hemicordylus capensis]
METTISERRGSQNLSRPFPWAEAGNASAQPAFPKPRERGFTAAGTGSHLARRKGEAPNPRFSVTSSCGALDFASEGPLSTCVCLLPRGTVCSADCVFNKLCHPEAEKGCVTAPAMTPRIWSTKDNTLSLGTLYLKEDIVELEKVQKRATKMIKDPKHLPLFIKFVCRPKLPSLGGSQHKNKPKHKVKTLKQLKTTIKKLG